MSYIEHLGFSQLRPNSLVCSAYSISQRRSTYSESFRRRDVSSAISTHQKKRKEHGEHERQQKDDGKHEVHTTLEALRTRVAAVGHAPSVARCAHCALFKRRQWHFHRRSGHVFKRRQAVQMDGLSQSADIFETKSSIDPSKQDVVSCEGLSFLSKI